MKKSLEIIFTSDIHGHVFPVDYPSGKPECSGLLNMAHQVKKGKNTLVLDGGDSLQGTPLSQYYIAHREEYPFHPVAEAFRALGCDYFTLGNHDFNFGYETLKDYVDAMRGVRKGACRDTCGGTRQGMCKGARRGTHWARKSSLTAASPSSLPTTWTKPPRRRLRPSNNPHHLLRQ